jgi:hypothetical protein
MKKIYLVFALLSSIMIINAQEEEKQVKDKEFKTIFGGTKIGGYGGIGLGYTMINDIDAVIFNARGAVILNHWLAMGLTGSGFVNEGTYYGSLNKDVSHVGGYGGILIEPIIFPKTKVHVSFPIVAGVGGISFTTFNDENDQEDRSNDIEASESFFVIEPGAEVEFNLFKFMRMSAFATYRYTSGIDLKNIASEMEKTSKTALNGFTVGLNMKFGKF